MSESTQSAESPEMAELDLEGQRAAVEGFLKDLMVAFGRSDATVSVTVGEDEALEAAVEGSELGLLVGQKGVTLQAVQELVRSMVQRQFVGQSHARVRVDVAGYRARRKEALERFALGVAETCQGVGRGQGAGPDVLGRPEGRPRRRQRDRRCRDRVGGRGRSSAGGDPPGVSRVP